MISDLMSLLVDEVALFHECRDCCRRLDPGTEFVVSVPRDQTL
jgi:hypothetical protein